MQSKTQKQLDSVNIIVIIFLWLTIAASPIHFLLQLFDGFLDLGFYIYIAQLPQIYCLWTPPMGKRSNHSSVFSLNEFVYWVFSMIFGCLWFTMIVFVYRSWRAFSVLLCSSLISYIANSIIVSFVDFFRSISKYTRRKLAASIFIRTFFYICWLNFLRCLFAFNIVCKKA